MRTTTKKRAGKASSVKSSAWGKNISEQAGSQISRIQQQSKFQISSAVRTKKKQQAGENSDEDNQKKTYISEQASQQGSTSHIQQQIKF